MEHGECHGHGSEYVTSLFSPILFLLFIIYILISIFVFLMFSHSTFFLFLSINTNLPQQQWIVWMDTNSFPTPRSLSQCSITLQHLIRTSPIGTRGASRACLAVRNISLFTHSLVLLYYYLYSYIHLCFSDFLILLFLSFSI